MNEKKLEYVKLIFYEDRKDYDKSWGEVYYKLTYGTNQVHRTYKEKLSKKEFMLCLRAFRLQEGTDALPFEKYQIYDAKTKKPLNMPYYLKKENKAVALKDKVKDGLSKAGEYYYSSRDKIESLKRREFKTSDKSLLNSIKGGIDDIKRSGKKEVNYDRKKTDGRKLFIRITSLASATVLLSVLSSFELKKHKIDFSDIIYITKIGDSQNHLDYDIRNDYERFEKIIKSIINNDQDINREDLEFINDYLYKLSRASNDIDSLGNFYEFQYINYLDKDSPDYHFFMNFMYDYSSITRNNVYKKNYAYDFCARGCNLLYYTVSALNINKSSYMPRKEDIYAFNLMSPLSKIVFLNQLKGVVVATDFSYHRGDEPYWWIGLKMNKESLLEKIDQMINDSIVDLEISLNKEKGENNKTI